MTCPECNTMFCYICKMTPGIGHYNGSCWKKKFYSPAEIHVEDVRIGALEGLRLAEEEMPDVELKFDPTIGMDLQN